MSSLAMLVEGALERFRLYTAITETASDYTKEVDQGSSDSVASRSNSQTTRIFLSRPTKQYA